MVKIVQNADCIAATVGLIYWSDVGPYIDHVCRTSYMMVYISNLIF